MYIYCISPLTHYLEHKSGFVELFGITNELLQWLSLKYTWTTFKPYVFLAKIPQRQSSVWLYGITTIAKIIFFAVSHISATSGDF